VYIIILFYILFFFRKQQTELNVFKVQSKLYIYNVSSRQLWRSVPLW